MWKWRDGLFQFVALMGWLFAGIFGLALFLQGTADDIELFIERHDGLLLSLGVVILVAAIGLATAKITNESANERERLANASAERREKFVQRMQALIKISDFRQEWINKVRQDLAEVQGLYFQEKFDGHFFTVLQRLKLYLNTKDDSTLELAKAMLEVDAALEAGDNTRQAQALSKFNWVGQSMLKAEWDRLKKDLEEAQKIEDILK